MSVANGLVDPPLWVDQQQYTHNRADPLAAVSRRLPLWFAATCLVGALCQPDVQATVRHLQETAEAVEIELGAVGGHDHRALAQADAREPKLDAASAVMVERIVAEMAAGKTGPGAQAAAQSAPATTGAASANPPANPGKVPVEPRDAAHAGLRDAAARASAQPSSASSLPSAPQPVSPRSASVRPSAIQPLVPANGRLADSYVLPAQRALVRHISSTWRVTDEQIQRYIAKVWLTAGELELDPFLVLAVMATESSFNHRAQSSRGAQGLMQVHTRVHKDKFKPHGGPQRAFDPEASIKVGSLILKQYLVRYGNPRGALKAYVGAANLKSDGGYANKVLRRHVEFKQVVRTELARLTAAGKLKADAVGGAAAGSNAAGNATRVAASSVNPGPASR